MGGGAGAGTVTAPRAVPPRVAALVAAWFASSLISLFLAKHVLDAHAVHESTFTLFQFAASLFFGLAATKALRLRRLEPLSPKQVRAILPLAIAFLVKEVLKYASIARVSVNLVNTIRSLGPVVTIALERSLFGHVPPRAVMMSMMPIVFGVVLTSMDEMHVASAAGRGCFVFLLGLSAAVASTAINQSQNVYSKILFGSKSIDPVSLQIYLSGLSFSLLTPFFSVRALYHAATTRNLPSFALPTPELASLLLLTGFVNFLASQLAFSTLSKISPVSYSVANTFKRVCIAIIAIVFVGEHLSPINGSGIVISIAGVYIYERASREYKAARMYRQASPQPAEAPVPRTPQDLPQLAPTMNRAAQAPENHIGKSDNMRKPLMSDDASQAPETHRLRQASTRSPRLKVFAGDDRMLTTHVRVSSPSVASKSHRHSHAEATILHIAAASPNIK